MIKGVIFDLDGTTIETLHDIHESVNETMRLFGYPERTFDEVRLGVGRGGRNLIRVSVPEGSDDETIDRVMKEYLQIYAKNCLNVSKPYEGMPELLRELQKRNIKMAVNSNKGNDLTNKMIKTLYPDIDFIEIMGETEGIPRKPDPSGALRIIDMMGLGKDEVLYVGDSEPDVQTAKNAGLRSVGCLWGYRNEEVLEKAGADYIISRPESLLNCLGD